MYCDIAKRREPIFGPLIGLQSVNYDVAVHFSINATGRERGDGFNLSAMMLVAVVLASRMHRRLPF
jgi:hypothetical protein